MRVSAQLALPLITPFLRADFAKAALRELQARERAYPELIEAGRMTRDAAATDIERWRVIEELLRTGSAATALSWADLEHATAAAFQRRAADYDAAADDPACPQDKRQDLLARRDAVYGIHERISWHRQTIERINGAGIGPGGTRTDSDTGADRARRAA